jgi:hypothetical protein
LSSFEILSITDDELIEIADKLDKDLVIKIKDDENAWKPLPKNNVRQKEAIYKALKSRFTLIQGPPGIYPSQKSISTLYIDLKL